ncbi:4Fe-4S binding protein [Planctomycetota bacterium]
MVKIVQLRRFSQLIFLVLFFYLLSAVSAPIILRNLFFITDPLLALSVMIATRTLLVSMLWALVVVVVSVVLGRVFCGWACPLGTLQDIFSKIIRPGKYRLLAGWHQVKYLVLLGIIILALADINISGWFDPIALTYHAFGFAAYHRFFISLFALVLLLTLVQSRFWCRNLCPLGALLVILSKLRILRLGEQHKCQQCQNCQKVCKMGVFKDTSHPLKGAVDEVGIPLMRNEGRQVWEDECIICYKCVANCSDGVLSLGLRGARLDTEPTLPERRGLIIAGALSLVSIPLLRAGIGRKKKALLPLLRPPSAIQPESKFLAQCLRCGQCINVCPTSGLQPLMLGTATELSGFWSPILVPRIGPCKYDCNLCGQTCPSKAIPKLELDEKRYALIGTAEIDENRCLVYSKEQMCRVCYEQCPVPGKAIRLRKDKYPMVLNDLCIGCGNCEYTCPIKGISAIRVMPLSDYDMK